MAEDQLWPTVSVVVATRDRPELLRRAIASILGQNYAGSIECIVVFDQSEPEPIEVQTSATRTITVIANARRPGLPGSRNSGLLTASGELIAFCDDDDEWLPEKLQEQIITWRQNPDASLITSGIYVHFRDADRVRIPPKASFQLPDFLRDRVMEIHPSTLLASRDRVLNDIGLVDESIPGGYCEDYDWILRASRLGEVISVQRPLVRVYWHSSSFFADRWRMIVDALQYLLAKHPDFSEEPRGLGRIEAQLAFAYASLGDRRSSWRWSRRAIRHRGLERRILVASLVNLRILRAQTVLDLAHRAGRGI